MGETRISFKVYAANGQAEELEAVVDTGATFSKVPRSLAVRLGLEGKYETEVELGDKRRIKRKLSLAEIEIEEVRRPVLVAIGEEERPVIGYTALELLGFRVNPITGELEKAIPIEYAQETAGLVIEVPPFKPQFLKDLIEVLGRPSSVTFTISGKEISEAAIKIGEMAGVKLEDRYIAGAPVHLDGETSIERILEIYEQWFRYRERLEKDRWFLVEAEKETPKVTIKEIRWHDQGHSIKFDEYRLEIDIAPDKDQIISGLIHCAKRHNMRIHINFR